MDDQGVRAMKPFGLRSYLLLVLLVLLVMAGLVAMHGLGPAPVPAVAHTGATSHHASAVGHERTTAADASSRNGCVHAGDPADDRGGGHAEHADVTCAATGTAGAPVLPAPAAASAQADAEAVLEHGVIPVACVCGRAPPSLSELQLLRI
ncbi:DUF6153 family protein [Streptomyces sp. NPDC023588]|uniref:DUF6153 family protein n=1 Tax=Streptomyces sp. NPDC023588 TaxID=3154907 RepID=UPI0033E09DCC